MSLHHRRRRNYGRREWARYHQNKRQEVAKLFGGIERDILHVFLHLPSFAREGLLSRYGDKFGRAAEQHARRTYSDWQSGAVQPAAKTLERLLEFLPPYLTDTHRFDLIRKLRAHHLKRKELYLTTMPGCWRDELSPIVHQLIEHGAQFELPRLVYEKATWLANGDAGAARKILQSIDEEEARLRLSYVEAEFKRIEYLVENVRNAEPVKHRTFDTASGRTDIRIKKNNNTVIIVVAVVVGIVILLLLKH